MLKQIDKDIAQLALKYALSKDSLGADIVLQWYKANIDFFTEEEIEALFEIKHNVRDNKNYPAKRQIWDEWSKLMRSKIHG